MSLNCDAGTKGQTGPHKLSNWFCTDFRKGKEVHFTVETTDVGDILLVQFDVHKGLFRKAAQWYAEKAIVSNNARDDKHHYNWGWITRQAVLYHDKGIPEFTILQYRKVKQSEVERSKSK